MNVLFDYMSYEFWFELIIYVSIDIMFCYVFTLCMIIVIVYKHNQNPFMFTINSSLTPKLVFTPYITIIHSTIIVFFKPS